MYKLKDVNGRVLRNDGKSYVDNTGYVFARVVFVIKPAVKLSPKYCYLEE